MVVFDYKKRIIKDKMNQKILKITQYYKNVYFNIFTHYAGIIHFFLKKICIFGK